MIRHHLFYRRYILFVILFNLHKRFYTTVIGLPDKLIGNKLVGLVAPVNGDQDKNKILCFCSERISKPKIPSDIVYVAKLPKKTSGKIDRKLCLTLYQQLATGGA